MEEEFPFRFEDASEYEQYMPDDQTPKNQRNQDAFDLLLDIDDLSRRLNR